MEEKKEKTLELFNSYINEYGCRYKHGDVIYKFELNYWRVIKYRISRISAGIHVEEKGKFEHSVYYSLKNENKNELGGAITGNEKINKDMYFDNFNLLIKHIKTKRKKWKEQNVMYSAESLPSLERELGRIKGQIKEIKDNLLTDDGFDKFINQIKK